MADGQMWNPIEEAKKRYPGVRDWDDKRIWNNMMDPQSFRNAFPEFKQLDDATIRRNIVKLAPEGTRAFSPAPEETWGDKILRSINIRTRTFEDESKSPTTMQWGGKYGLPLPSINPEAPLISLSEFLPRSEHTKMTKTGAIGRGALDVISGFTTPDNVALLAATYGLGSLGTGVARGAIGRDLLTNPYVRRLFQASSPSRLLADYFAGKFGVETVKNAKPLMDDYQRVQQMPEGKDKDEATAGLVYRASQEIFGGLVAVGAAAHGAGRGKGTRSGVRKEVSPEELGRKMGMRSKTPPEPPSEPATTSPAAEGESPTSEPTGEAPIPDPPDDVQSHIDSRGEAQRLAANQKLQQMAQASGRDVPTYLKYLRERRQQLKGQRSEQEKAEADEAQRLHDDVQRLYTTGTPHNDLMARRLHEALSKVTERSRILEQLHQFAEANMYVDIDDMVRSLNEKRQSGKPLTATEREIMAQHKRAMGLPEFRLRQPGEEPTSPQPKTKGAPLSPKDPRSLLTPPPPPPGQEPAPGQQPSPAPTEPAGPARQLTKSGAGVDQLSWFAGQMDPKPFTALEAEMNFGDQAHNAEAIVDDLEAQGLIEKTRPDKRGNPRWQLTDAGKGARDKFKGRPMPQDRQSSLPEAPEPPSAQGEPSGPISDEDLGLPPQEKQGEPSGDDLARHIKSAGLVDKGKFQFGEMSVHQFEHPDFPGITSSLKAEQMTDPEAVKTAMRGTLQKFGKELPADLQQTGGDEQPAPAVGPPSVPEPPPDAGGPSAEQSRASKRYISGLRSDAKKKYAQDVWDHLIHGGDEPTRGELSTTAGDAIRKKLYGLMGREFTPGPPEPPTEQPSTAGVFGNPFQLETRDGTFRVRPRVIPVEAKLTSHDPTRQFEENPKYPEGVQERDYRNNPAYQQQTRKYVDDEKFSLFTDRSVTGVDGPSQSLPDGTVLNGNGRSMAEKLIYSEGGERADRFRTAVINALKQYGIEPEQVSGIKNPTIDLEILDAPTDIDGIKSLARALNKPLTKASDEWTQAINAGEKLSEGSADRITAAINDLSGEDKEISLRALMAKEPSLFRDILINDKIMQESDLPAYFTQAGEINDAGKIFIENALLGSVIRDAELLKNTPDSIKAKLTRSLSNVLQVINHEDPAWNIRLKLEEAIRETIAAKGKGIKLVDHVNQPSLTGEGVPPDVATLALALAEKPTNVAKMFRTYASAAREARNPTMAMFGSETPAEAFSRSFEPSDDEGGGTGRNADRPMTSTGPRRSSELSPRRADRVERGDGSALGALPPAPPTAVMDDPATMTEPPAPTTKDGGIVRAFLTQDAIPTAQDALSTVVKFGQRIKQIFAPETVDKDAKLMATITRRHWAWVMNRQAQDHHAFMQFHNLFVNLGREGRMAFLMSVEEGTPLPSPELQKAADLWRQIQTETWNEVRKRKGIRTVIENYVPHYWKDPDAARNVLLESRARRPLEGPKSMFKKRDFLTIREGLAKGLELATDDPIEIFEAKLLEMRKFIAGHDIMAEGKTLGLARFVHAMAGNSKVPEGWDRIKDPVGTVYAPPTMTISEAVDGLLFDDLNDFAKSIGAQHFRKVKLPGGMLGYQQGDQVVTKVATPMGTLAHEIGHYMDSRYGLAKMLVNDKATKQELRSLADLRFERDDPSDSYRKYVRKGGEKIANLIDMYVTNRERLKRLAPNTYSIFHAFVKSHEELEPLTRMEPSQVRGEKSYEQGLDALQVLGHYYMPSSAARVLNNHLSSGLRGEPGYQIYRQLSNTLNAVQLGWSFFHVTFTGNDAAVSKFALGLRNVAAGKLSTGAGEMARGNIIVAPIETMIKGNRMMHAFFEEGPDAMMNRKIFDELVESGGRAKMEDFYKNSAVEKFWNAWHDNNKIGAVGLRAIPAIIEEVAKPIMEEWVPRLKLGVWSDLTSQELERNPHTTADVFRHGEHFFQNLNPEKGRFATEYARFLMGDGEMPEPGDRLNPKQIAEIMERTSRVVELSRVNKRRESMQRSWDSVDNRLGQLVYDNQFWHRTLKDLGMASVRALGWTIGSFKEFGGGAADLFRLRLTPKASYVVSLPIVMGMQGAMLNYIMTGSGPKDIKDYFFPRTGKTNPDGTPERISIPSYMKDWYNYSEGFQYGLEKGVKQLASTLQHKIHPAIEMVLETLENRDFYGTQIRNPDDPAVKQLQDYMGYIGEQFLPFSARNAMQRAQATGERGSQRFVSLSGIESMFGILPAPKSVDRTKAEQMVGDYMRDKMPQGARSKDDAARAQFRSEVLKRMNMKDEAAVKDLADAIRTGQLRQSDADQIRRRMRYSWLQAGFQRLSLQQGLRVFDAADDHEKALLRPMLARKARELRLMSPADRDRYLKELRRAIGYVDEEPGPPTAPPTAFGSTMRPLPPPPQ